MKYEKSFSEAFRLPRLFENCTKFFDDFCESEKHRLLNFIPVGIGVGIILYFSLPNEPNFFTSISVLILSVFALFFVKNFKWLFRIFLCFSLGFFLSQLRTKLVDTKMLMETNGCLTSFVATVKSCEKTEKGLVFNVEKVKSRRYPYLGNLQLSWRGAKAIGEQQDYLPGSRVLFSAILSPVSPQAFPGAYDFRKQQYFKGIGARGFIAKTPKLLKKAENLSFCMLIEQLRHHINKKIESYLKKDTAAISEALTTGNKSGISQEIRSCFSNSGTAHILAISGLHMGIIGFFIFWLFRVILCCFPAIAMFYDVKKIAAVLSWFAVLFYLYLSGNSVSAVRAFIMHTLIIVAILLNRTPITMRSVAIAATIIMVFTPEAILFPSFQMSFGAVIAIVAFFENRVNKAGVFHKLSDSIITTLVASVPTTLFSVHVFNQLTLNSVLANVIAIPLMSFFIMPVAVVCMFLMIFDAAECTIRVLGAGVDLLIAIAKTVSKLPGSFFVIHTPSPVVMTIFVLSGLLITLVHHRIRRFGFVGILIGFACYYFQAIPDIFLSPNGKAIGIKTEDVVCFNHLGYFRSMASSWTKSIGFEKRENFNSKACSKYITKIDENTYVANIKNEKVIISSSKKKDTRVLSEPSICEVFLGTRSAGPEPTCGKRESELQSDTKNTAKIPLQKNSINADAPLMLHINQEPNEQAELIYLPSKDRASLKNVHRPWSVMI